jgi:hypothetical protein
MDKSGGKNMKKSLFVGVAILFLTTSTLSGCFWRAEEHETGPADYHDRDRGDDHGEHHDDQEHNEDHGYHR